MRYFTLSNYIFMKKSLARGIKERKEIKSPQHKSNSYKNISLNKIPETLLKDLKDLTILDISHNMLENIHINTIFKSSTKLKTAYINDNLANIIPSSLTELKHLVELRHDWNILFNKTNQQKLDELKVICRKPEKLVKVSSVLGINFTTYCETIMKLKLGQNNKQFINVIKVSDCSTFAKEDMINLLGFQENPDQAIKISNITTKKIFDCNYACFNDIFSLNKDKKQEVPKIQDKVEKKPCNNIKISGIKTIENNKLNESTISEINSTRDSFIMSPDKKRIINIHKLFSKFDSHLQTNIAEADSAFRQGANPNSYDKNGLTIFHTCVINNQLEGLKFLFDIKKKNPGFLDLQICTGKEGKNIFHLSVFLKRLAMTKLLIQNGFPTEKRDNLGNRAINLVDQNYEFLYNMKKQLKKNKFSKKEFLRHPSKYQQQSQILITENRNQNLLAMYNAATAPRSNNMIRK